MLTLLKSPADHVVALHLAGHIDQASLAPIIKECDERLARHERISLLVEIERFGLITPAALLNDIGYALRHLGDFEREAIISKADWLRHVTEFSKHLVRSIEVRHFSPDEREAAYAWVAEPPRGGSGIGAGADKAPAGRDAQTQAAKHHQA
ncbi:hypothetical protein KP05_00645 [Cobetia amphilecti]|uniref:STAS/SEC14 domain-containing protein n=1 Tax=Cobetia amphilecti TaxID=1055104 RepID=UPI0005055295|nr:STAS/SEC14 domain-containing protein [Cobetia amphilecti]KGA03365.1 hypothetical protein KP05_00645 [Cobetia amphilecti]